MSEPLTILWGSIWKFRPGSVDTDPGSEQFNWDDAANPTKVAISTTDDDGHDRKPQLMALVPNDVVWIRSNNRAGDWRQVTISAAPHDLITWVSLDVALNQVGADVTVPAGNNLLLFDFLAPANMSSQAWITENDLKNFLGITPTDTFDTAWLTQCVASANDWAFRKRKQAGYTDVETIAPDDAAKTGTTLYAATLFRERGSVEQFNTFEDFASATVAGSMAQINRLLGIPRAMAY